MREAVRRERDVVRGRAHHGRIRHVPRAEHEVDRGARVLDVRDRIQGTRAADRLARADERRGARGALRRDEVEGPALVVVAPAAPVAAALEERAEGVGVHGAGYGRAARVSSLDRSGPARPVEHRGGRADRLRPRTVSPDPRWAIYPLMGVLFIITAAFRLGWGGTLAATAILSLEIVGVAIWRDLALGLRVDTPYVAFDLLMYGLTALLTTAMLNELGALRRERTVLMARASDVEILRRAERERGELLDRERSARAEAELATARLEALQQVADAALSRARLDDVLPEILERVAQLFDADFAVVLQRAQAQGTYALRASSTRGQVPRTVVLLQSGDAERAITSRRPIAIADHSTREIDTILGAQVREAALAPLYAGGDLVGLLYVMRHQGRAFSADELGLLGLVGDRVAAAVERGALPEAGGRARAEAEAAEARMRLLLQAGDALGTESALERRLEDITRIAVPKLADLCAVDLLENDGALRPVALAAVEVGMERDNWALSSRIRRDRTHAHPVWEVIDAVKPTLWDELDPERIGRLAWSPGHLRMMLERDVCSWMAVPLADDGIRGVMVFVNAQSQRHFTADDLATAQQLASRVANAIVRSALG